MSNLLTKNALLGMLLSLITGLGATAARSEDRVYPQQGVVAVGKISELSPTSVKINVRGKDQTYEISEVRKVSFDGEPTGLDRARESSLLGQYEQALDEIKKIPTEELDNPLVKQDVAYYRYFSEGKLGLAGGGDKVAAIKGLLDIVRSNPQTHHLYDLSELLGELAMAVGQPEQAARYFNVLLSASNADTIAVGVYHLGEVDLAQDKTEQARQRFQQLVSAPSKSPEMTRLKSLAEVGLAVCDNLAGETQKALDKLDAMVQQHDSTDYALFARINNAKGACYRTLGQTNRALLSYLQTDLLFFTDAEAHAEALYHLAQLWPSAGEPARAAEARSRLVAEYAASTWANKK